MTLSTSGADPSRSAHINATPGPLSSDCGKQSWCALPRTALPARARHRAHLYVSASSVLDSSGIPRNRPS